MDKEVDLVSDEAFQETISKSDAFIDATQSAIIDAAENVSGIFESSPDNVTTPIEVTPPFYTEIEFWVGVAFILTVIVLARPVISFIKAALNNKIRHIISSIDEATKLRDDAQILLSDAQRKFINAENEAKQILDKSSKAIQDIKDAETLELKTSLKYKEQETKRRMEALTSKIKDDINKSASKLSVNLAQKAIYKYIKETDKEKLIDEAIEDLDNFIS